MKLTIPSDLLVGQYLQLIALHIAAAIAATYTLGYTLGHFIHAMNDTLTSLLKQLKDAPYLSTEWWGIVQILESINAKDNGLATTKRG
jgi:hypothetical protein